jgi:hypothetical protein
MPLIPWVINAQIEVYSLDAHLLGTVAEAWPSEYSGSPTLARMVGKTGQGYFRLTGNKGGDLYVPIEALADFTEERLRIKYTRAQIRKQGWDKRPEDLPGNE